MIRLFKRIVGALTPTKGKSTVIEIGRLSNLPDDVLKQNGLGKYAEN